MPLRSRRSTAKGTRSGPGRQRRRFGMLRPTAMVLTTAIMSMSMSVSVTLCGNVLHVRAFVSSHNWTVLSRDLREPAAAGANLRRGSPASRQHTAAHIPAIQQMAVLCIIPAADSRRRRPHVITATFRGATVYATTCSIRSTVCRRRPFMCAVVCPACQRVTGIVR
jgi:hypothetical protein